MYSLCFGRLVTSLTLFFGLVTWSSTPAVGTGITTLASDPAATSANSPCQGGPGRIWLTVHAPDEGTYVVDVVARGLADGPRWNVSVGAEDGRDPQGFHPRARDGGWTISTTLTSESRPNDVLFSAIAHDGRRGGSECLVSTFPSHPTAGLSTCGRGLHALVARRIDAQTVVVRYLNVTLRGQVFPWFIELTAIGGGTREATSFTSHTNKYGLLRSRVEFRNGAANQRYQVDATSIMGLRCRLGLNPGHLSVSGKTAPSDQTIIRAAKRLHAPSW